MYVTCKPQQHILLKEIAVVTLRTELFTLPLSVTRRVILEMKGWEQGDDSRQVGTQMSINQGGGCFHYLLLSKKHVHLGCNASKTIAFTKQALAWSKNVLLLFKSHKHIHIHISCFFGESPETFSPWPAQWCKLPFNGSFPSL